MRIYKNEGKSKETGIVILSSFNKKLAFSGNIHFEYSQILQVVFPNKQVSIQWSRKKKKYGRTHAFPFTIFFSLALSFTAYRETWVLSEIDFSFMGATDLIYGLKNSSE